MALKVNVTFTEGVLAKFKADVIVNSTSQLLTLKSGRISRSIQREAGDKLQEECKRSFPDGICFGEVAVTSGYKLQCKNVYHVALPAWNLPFLEPQQILCQIVCNCLQQAHKDQMVSIAFPTLGCGFLNYPLDVVTETMCQCIAKFESHTRKSTLKEVFIVIYNKGEDWKHIKQAFLQTQRKPQDAKDPISKNVKDFLSTCQRESVNNSCGKSLRCGHLCLGYKNEKTCPPCLHETCGAKGAGQTQGSEDDCVICYTENLAAAPIIILKCGHAFHLHCTKRILQNKWVGPRLTFNFMLCPLCKVPMDHPELKQLLGPLQALHDDVRRKAMMRLTYEGLDKSDEITKKGNPYFGKPEMYAMERYCYYPCFTCKKPYFGGAVECDAGAQDGEFKMEELVCPSCCGNKTTKICQIHGDEFLEYKCQHCCSVAVYFCFGTSHFCEYCHDHCIFGIPKSCACPVGPGGKQLQGKCPLGVNHPPNGQEFCLGCGLCSHIQMF